MSTELDELEFYRDKAGEIRWTYSSAGNHEKLGDSGEGYKNEIDAVAGAQRVTGLRIDRGAIVASAEGGTAVVTRPDGTAAKVLFTGL